ncbi:MAG: stage 0 sporulation protein J, partial [Chloroflexota bacterium]|nr:stage 0 sporulation protein J [Chloroflexota bacterium]
ITEGHARAILQVPGETEQIHFMEHIVAEGLNVRQAEAQARRWAPNPPTTHPATEEEPPPLYDETHDLEERFRDALGTKVQLSRTRRGGRLTIYYYSDEELQRIYGTIVGE